MKKFLFTTAMLFIVGLMWSQVNVTFRVDMSGVSGFTTPEVNGTFNGWCGSSCNPMTDANSDGVWETTIALNAGSYQFKYAYDNWYGQESLVAGTPCTITLGGFTNRDLTVDATDIVMPIVCFGSCSACGASSLRAVTFQVDLSNNSGFTTPTVNGTFNGWSGTANPLTDDNSDGIWETTLNIPDGTYEYKFAYDNWTGQESLIAGSSCTVTNSGFTNRRVVVSADATLPVVCWNSCSNCAAALLPKNVTFKVDMQNVSGFTTAYVNGSFNGWCGDCNPLTDANADGIWETTLQLNQDTFEYKFTYDGWTGQENLTPGSSCTSTLGGYTNRSIIVGGADVVLPVACWELCTSCAPPTRNVTFKVNMQNVSGFTTPCVNGSWDGWAGGSHPMTDANADGIWETTIALTDGAYEYKFAYDGWSGSEQLTSGSSCTVTNGGFTNRSLTVNGTAIVLSEVCWASCNSCSAPTRSITFNINMANETGFSTPYISGTMNGWCGDCAAMTDANGDGIYSVTLALQDGTYEYKVSIDGWAGSEQLTQGTSCTVTNSGYTNRRLVVSGVDQNMAVACYASCSDCVAEVAVTFQVNMSQVTGFTTPTVNGQFNGFSGNANSMSDGNGDGIYNTTIYMVPGTYEFKFAADNWNIQENLIPGLPCTVTNYGFTNRQITVSADTILPVTCWAACGECIVNYDVTFQVDMSNETGFTIPEVNGDFNNWCGGCFQLTDPDGNGIYTGTATIQSGSHEFKFAHDGWAGQESLTAGTSCTTTNYGFTNRLINVTHDVVLPVVCYGACSSCGYAVSNDSPYSAVNVQYNTNANFPNCYAINGSTVNASNSPQSGNFSGKDTWYKFTAPSTAVSISLSGSSQDDAIELFTKVGQGFVSVASENASIGNTDFERLNYSGLTVGTQYWISVGAASGTDGSAFTLCIQNLMPSGCASTVPAGGFNLCDTYRATYRGAASQGVSYDFHFNGTGGGATGTTSVSGMNLCVLSNPALGLRYGGTYSASVDVNYAMTDAAGAAEPMTVVGAASGLCSSLAMHAQPNMEVKSTQRCPATLLRGNYLAGASVAGDVRLCSAINYSYQFTQVASCSNGTVVSLTPAVYTTNSSTPYLQLGVLQNLPFVGAWDVRIRPNFTYGSGSFGPAQRIRVSNTAAGAMLSEDAIDTDERSLEIETEGFAVYPNPSTGEILNVNITDLQSEKINVRILDATGRVVLNNQYSVDGSLNTMIEFAEPLQNGMYMVEYTDNTIVKSQRLVIQH